MKEKVKKLRAKLLKSKKLKKLREERIQFLKKLNKQAAESRARMCAKYVIKERQCFEKQDEARAIGVQHYQKVTENMYLNDKLQKTTEKKEWYK